MSEKDTKKKTSRKIVVVGAGLVGALQALLLARSGHQVTLVEARALASFYVGKSDRTVALAHRSYQLLTTNDMWPAVDCGSIESIVVTRRGQFGSVKLKAKDIDINALGYVLPNSEFEKYLHEHLLAHSDVHIFESCVLQDVVSSDAGTKITLRHSDERITRLEADLLVAADGTASVTRQMLGIKTRCYNYKQVAVIANVHCSQPHRNIAHERFTEHGPLALLPLADATKYSMVFTIPTADAKHIERMADEEFLQLLRSRFGGKVGRFESIGDRVQVPLKLTESLDQTVNTSVLIGNAARTLHPVAGQGLNLAIRDVFELVSCLSADVPISHALADFVTGRVKDQRLVTRQTDLLARAFQTKPWPLQAPFSMASGISFLLLDFASPLKKRFAQLNMGQHVQLPGNSPR